MNHPVPTTCETLPKCSVLIRVSLSVRRALSQPPVTGEESGAQSLQLMQLGRKPGSDSGVLTSSTHGPALPFWSRTSSLPSASLLFT